PRPEEGGNPPPTRPRRRHATALRLRSAGRKPVLRVGGSAGWHRYAGRVEERLMISYEKDERPPAPRGKTVLSSACLCAERSSPMLQRSRCLLLCVFVGSLGLVSCATVRQSVTAPAEVT